MMKYSEWCLITTDATDANANAADTDAADADADDDNDAVEWRWSMQNQSNGTQVLRWLYTWSSPLMESHEEERGKEV